MLVSNVNKSSTESIRESSPTFVLGNQRSSTTFLARLLMKTKTASFGCEDGIIRYLIIYYSMYFKNSDLVQYSRITELLRILKAVYWDKGRKIRRIEHFVDYIERISADGELQKLYERNSVEELIRSLAFNHYQQIGHKEGKANMKIWGDKYPEFVLMLDDLNRIFPESRYIFISRHPLTNIEAVYRKKSKGNMSDIQAVKLSIKQYVDWNIKWIEFSQKIDSGRILEVKYEEFLGDVNNYISQVEKFTGVSLSSNSRNLEQLKKIDPSKGKLDMTNQNFRKIRDFLDGMEIGSICRHFGYMIIRLVTSSQFNHSYYT